MNHLQNRSSLALDTGDHDQISILIVDDDELDRESIRRMLGKFTQQNFEIDEARGFAEAEKMLQDKVYDSCLIDYYLDGRTGIELLESIKHSNPNSSVILLTGLDEDSIDKDAMNAGASDYLCKDEISAKLLGRTIQYSVHQKKIDRDRDFLAHHDSLTQLVNRTLFFDRLSHAVERATRQELECTILYIDVDHFKQVNDEFGHEAGDILLCELAKRLKQSVRGSDTVARLGGDEFAILLEDVNKANSHYVSQKILHAVEQPFEVFNAIINVSISLGMTRFPNHTDNINQLLMQADQALYLAKKDGKRTYRKYSEELQKELERSRWIEKEFESAIEKNEIGPFYQPQYCLLTGKVSGFESLARWQHATEGFISPGEFVPLAEKLSLMSLMTRMMIEKSSSDFLRLKEVFPKSHVAVNISASDCMTDQLVPCVERIIHELHIAPSDLELEVTESLLMQNIDKAAEVLGTLHTLGVRIAIDDFGTGFSSLSYLTELPIDTLKIDLQFVQGIGKSSQKESVIKVIIDLAKRLGFETVGEGVETQYQADFLRANGCDYVQGYLFSKPLPFDECLLLSSTGGRLNED